MVRCPRDAVICQIIFPVGLIAQGALASLTRVHFPRLAPNTAAAIVQNNIRARAAGRVPRVGTDPFTGNVLLSTEDQEGIVNQLAQEAATRAAIQQAINELTAEDPLIFIRGLPYGDPRRIAAGLDPPDALPRPSTGLGVQQVVAGAEIREGPKRKGAATLPARKAVSSVRPSLFASRLSYGGLARY